MILCLDAIYINNNKKNLSQENIQLKLEKKSASLISGLSTLAT